MIGIVLLGLLAAGGAGAESPGRDPGDQARFDALVSEIRALREDLEHLDRQERGTVAEMDRLQTEAALHAREAARLEYARQQAGRDLGRLRSELDGSRAEVKEAEAALAARLKEVYLHGRQREVRVLLAVARPVDLLRGVAYLDVMASRQGAALSRLQSGRQRAESLESALTAQVDALEALAAEQRETADSLADARENSARLLVTVREDAEAHRSAIAELARAAEQLEAAIVAGQQGYETAIDPSRLKGALPWPAEGRIAVPFGDIVHPRFRTVTPHRGVDIQTEPGAPIRAVLGGRVVFGRRFAGYGNTVLVDHGGRYMSVYARAAVLKVAEGEEVLPGQELGVADEAAPGGEAPTIYFEWRHEGKTLDPARWLKRASLTQRAREDSR
ncbi:MAG: murein hydrolase activator EnvC family protein [Candidatus Polarisedimenticolia bacterium]